MKPSTEFPRRFVAALAAWSNLVEWTDVGEAAVATNDIVGNHLFGGLTANLPQTHFDVARKLPGRLHGIRAFFSRIPWSSDLDMILGVGEPDLDRYERIFTANAIGGWEILTRYPIRFDGARAYVRRFRFGVEPPDFVTVELVLIYTAAARSEG